MFAYRGGFIGLASGVYRLFWGGVLRPEEIFLASTRLRKLKRPRLRSNFRRVLRPQRVASAYFFSTLLSISGVDIETKDSLLRRAYNHSNGREWED